MGSWRRVTLLLLTLWILVATNPSSTGSKSFRKFITEIDRSQSTAEATCEDNSLQRICIQSRRAFPNLGRILESFFAPHRNNPSPHLDDPDLHFESIDYAVFTIVRTRSATAGDEPLHGFIGILGMWLPVPDPARLTGSVEHRNVVRFLRRNVPRAKRSTFALFAQDFGSFESFRERSLPDRPWEWLIAYFTVIGALWLMFPGRAPSHFTLTWHNVRHKGNWWCMVFFHFSHGGSWLRLCRTIFCVNYIAPILVSQHIVTLSGLYGIFLTASATSTALGMLVLARRHIFVSGQLMARSPLEIDGGGACIYALLVAACLSPRSNEPLPGGARPFELLMLNVLFDSFFLAGQKRIADYIAHTGGALGSWLFYSINQSGHM